MSFSVLTLEVRGEAPVRASRAETKIGEEEQEAKMLDSVTQCRVTSADDAGNKE